MRETSRSESRPEKDCPEEVAPSVNLSCLHAVCSYELWIHSFGQFSTLGLQPGSAHVFRLHRLLAAQTVTMIDNLTPKATWFTAPNPNLRSMMLLQATSGAMGETCSASASRAKTHWRAPSTVVLVCRGPPYYYPQQEQVPRKSLAKRDRQTHTASHRLYHRVKWSLSLQA